TLEIRRDGARRSELEKDRIRVIDRERGLSNNVYEGAKTAVVELRDLRVGDSVAFEYTIVGAKPVLAGHVMRRWLLGLPSGVGMIRHRTLSDHPLFLSPSMEGTHVERRRLGVLYEYSATATQSEPIPLEQNLPPDYEPYASVQVTDFSEWSDVT